MTVQHHASITLSKMNTNPAVIVFGNDDCSKPHASTFNSDQRDAAVRAAGLMGFRALAVEGKALIALAARLPAGKVFSSGKGFVPFVKREVAQHLDQIATDHPDQLIAVLPAKVDAASETSGVVGAIKPPSDPVASAPKDWTDIKVGSRVLAVDDPSDGWWEAIVHNVHESGTKGFPLTMLTLKWEAFADEKAFVRRFDHVALIHPNYYGDATGAGAA